MGYNSIGAPRLDSFAAAVKWHNEVKPIRGHAEQVRPLGSRRYHGAASISMPDPDTVLLNYYGNTLVRWQSDNTFTLFAPKYCSAYSGDQIIGFVPRSVGFNWVTGRLFVQLSGSRHVELTRRQSLKFVPIDKTSGGYPIFEIADAPDVQVYRVKRGRADAIVKQRFSAFLEWVALTTPIANGTSNVEITASCEQLRSALGYTNEFLDAQMKAVEGLPWGGKREMVSQAINDVHRLPYSPNRGAASFHKASSELLAEWMSDNNMECWLNALHVIKHHAGQHMYNDRLGKKGVYIDGLRLYDYVKSIAAFLHRDEAFKVVTLPAGTVPSKRNVEYFREMHVDFGQTDTVSECS